jgi:hypothetical protein
MTFTVDGAGEVAILALQSDADRARQIVEDYLGQLRAEAPSESDTEE